MPRNHAAARNAEYVIGYLEMPFSRGSPGTPGTIWNSAEDAIAVSDDVHAPSVLSSKRSTTAPPSHDPSPINKYMKNRSRLAASIGHSRA